MSVCNSIESHLCRSGNYEEMLKLQFEDSFLMTKLWVH